MTVCVLLYCFFCIFNDFILFLSQVYTSRIVFSINSTMGIASGVDLLQLSVLIQRQTIERS